MTDLVSPGELAQLLSGRAPFALVDLRDTGEYNSSHIPGSSLIPRRELEFRMPEAAPFLGVQVVVCDDDGQRAAFAAGTLTRMGYADVSVLDGGMNRWVVERRPTEWGVNVPSKEFGERVQVERGVPEMTGAELALRITDITGALDEDTTVVANCAGRTRSALRRGGGGAQLPDRVLL